MRGIRVRPIVRFVHFKSAGMSPKYINGDDLASIIKSSDKIAGKDYIVVDVRDDDYVGGNIKNSHNLPSYVFSKNVDDLVRKTKDVPMVIFHCALSQERGPKAARMYEQTREHFEKSAGVTPHDVLVLRGGFTQFQTKFRHDAELVENWDADVWASEWS